MWRFLRNGKEIVSFYWNRRAVLRIYKNGEIVWEALRRIAIRAGNALKSSHLARIVALLVKTMRGTQQKVKSNVEASVDRANIGSFSLRDAVKSATTAFLTYIGLAKPKVDDRISSTVTSSAEQIFKGSMDYESRLQTAGKRTANPLEVRDAEAVMASRTAGERTAYSAEAFDVFGKQDSVFSSTVTADRFLPRNVIAIGEAQSSADGHGTAFSPKEISCGIISESDFVASVKKFVAVGVRSETHEYSAGQGRISKRYTSSAMVERDYSDYSASVLSFLPKQIKGSPQHIGTAYTSRAEPVIGKNVILFVQSARSSYGVKMKVKDYSPWAEQSGDVLSIFRAMDTVQTGGTLYIDSYAEKTHASIDEDSRFRGYGLLGTSDSLIAEDSCEFKTVATAGTGNGVSTLTESTFKSSATAKSKEVMEDAWAVQTGDSLHVFQVLSSEQDGEILYLRELEDWATQTEQTVIIKTAYEATQNNEDLEVK